MGASLLALAKSIYYDDYKELSIIQSKKIAINNKNEPSRIY